MIRLSNITLSARFVALSSALMFFSVLPDTTRLVAGDLSFKSDIAPILVDQCVACHSARKAEGGYRVDTFEELLKSGDSGAPPIGENGDLTGELLRRITTDDPYERMPAEADALPAEQVELVKQWLTQGAKFDGEQPDKQLALVVPPPTHPAAPEHYSAAMPITAVALTPAGDQVVSAGYYEATAWNTADSTLVRRIPNLPQRIFGLAFSPDGQTLAVAGGEPGRMGEVRLLDFASGGLKGVVARSTDVIFDVKFSPDGTRLATSGADSLIRIIDIATLAEQRVIASHADWVTAVAWSDDGRRLASASRDKSSKVFDLESGQLLANYQAHGSAVRGVAFLPSGEEVITGGATHSLHRWKVADSQRVAEVGLGGESFQLSRRGNLLAVPCAHRRLVIVNLDNNAISGDFAGSEDWVLSTSIAADGSALVSGEHNGQVRLWNVADAQPRASWKALP